MLPKGLGLEFVCKGLGHPAHRLVSGTVPQFDEAFAAFSTLLPDPLAVTSETDSEPIPFTCFGMRPVTARLESCATGHREHRVVKTPRGGIFPVGGPQFIRKIHRDANTPKLGDSRHRTDLEGPVRTSNSQPLRSQFGTDRRLLLAVLTRFADGATACFPE